jgi:CubicO group peptidase (beta-lactamase class C family)
MLRARALLALVLLPVPAAAQPAPRSGLADRLDAWLQPLVDDGQLSGTLLVGQGDEVVYERSFGLADAEEGVHNTPETRLAVGAVSEAMTELLVLQLVAERKLSRADTVSRWIGDFPRGPEITVAHLLDHTSGLPPRVTSDDEETVARSPADMVRLASRHALLFTPGSRQLRSPAGYAVLARLAELATGQPFADLVRQRVFDPAGMTRSLHATARDIVPRRATPWLPWPAGSVRPGPRKDLSYLVGSGSVLSTPRDLFLLARALRSRKLGSAGQDYMRGRAHISWLGGGHGFRAFLEDDGAGLTVAFAANLPTGAVGRLRADLPRLVRGARVPPPARLQVAPVPVGHDLLERYAGRYGAGPDALDVVVHADGMLVADDRVLVPVGPDRFFSMADYGVVVFVAAPDGRFTALEWTPAGGRRVRMERGPG